MAETFNGTMRVKRNVNMNYTRRLSLEDVETGKEYVIFPVELFELLKNQTFTGTWREFRKGGVRSIKPIKEG